MSVEQLLLLDVKKFLAENYCSGDIRFAKKDCRRTHQPPLSPPPQQTPTVIDGVCGIIKDIKSIIERMREETFSQMLLRLIRESGLTNVECYKRAQITKQHFSKIQSKRRYQPEKETVFAFALALELSEEIAKELMAKAGYAFSSSSKMDLIVQYAINHRIYDLFTVNELLYHFGESPLV